jgi:hypothetical protein
MSPNPNLTTSDVLEALRASGKPLHEWGRAVDGTPLLAARAGGDKQPAIFITAGAHSTETAGVHGALNLLDALDTEHEVHVLPVRDPFGFAGVNHCLSFAVGQPVEVPSHHAALDYLTTHGELIWSEGEMRVFKLGNIGFMWHLPQPPSVGRFLTMHSRMLSLVQQDPDSLKPLWGKSVMLLNAMLDVEGSGELGRCWHAIVSPQGEWLHLNRFFGRDDAPPEVAAVDQLMQTIRPGLMCDLHEGNGSGFWMPIRKPEQNAELVFDMTKAFFDYIQKRGYPITTFENWAATDETLGKNYTPDWMKPEPRLPGLFWCDGLLRDEGYNLIDYSALFGIGYGTEAPMERPLAMRVDGITNGIKAAIQVWEQMV